jgi:tRNA (guanosine-2'-O-)-methyltransferase
MRIFIFSMLFLSLCRSYYLRSSTNYFSKPIRSAGLSFSSKGPENFEIDDELWKHWSYASGKEHQIPILTEPNGYKPDDPLWLSLDQDTIAKSNDILKQLVQENRLRRFKEIVSLRTNRIRFIFENPNKPNNIWAALRTLDSFGIQFVDVVLNKTTHGSSFIRSKDMSESLGSQKWMSVTQHTNLEFIHRLQKLENFVVLATDLHGNSLSFPELDLADLYKKSLTTSEASQVDNFSPKIAIVMGNELTGISDEMRSLSDHLIRIPLKGFAESLNLSVATSALCAFLEAKKLLQPCMTEEEKERVLFVWLIRSIKNSLAMLSSKGINLR